MTAAVTLPPRWPPAGPEAIDSVTVELSEAAILPPASSTSTVTGGVRATPPSAVAGVEANANFVAGAELTIWTTTTEELGA